MRRRDFILGSGATIAGQLTAHAQQSAMPVIGWFSEVPPGPLVDSVSAAFRRGMAELGYVEGKNYATDLRLNPESLTQAAADLVRLNVNVVFAAGPAALAAASKATTGIPVVGIDLESDPVAMGYVKSLGRPGGNITGMFLDIPELSGKQVQLLKQIVPQLSRIAIFGALGLNAQQFKASETAAQAFNIEAEFIEVRVPYFTNLKSCRLWPSLSRTSAIKTTHRTPARWPNSFPSFPCLTYFQRTAAYWLMGRM